MICPPSPYHDVAWMFPMKLPSQASPTVGTVSPSANMGPSCMSSTVLGVTHTKSGGLAASRSLAMAGTEVSGTTSLSKSARDVTAGKKTKGLWRWR